MQAPVCCSCRVLRLVLMLLDAKRAELSRERLILRIELHLHERALRKFTMLAEADVDSEDSEDEDQDSVDSEDTEEKYQEAEGHR